MFQSPFKATLVTVSLVFRPRRQQAAMGRTPTKAGKRPVPILPRTLSSSRVLIAEPPAPKQPFRAVTEDTRSLMKRSASFSVKRKRAGEDTTSAESGATDSSTGTYMGI